MLSMSKAVATPVIASLTVASFIVLGLGWSDAADAVGYSSLPRSKAQIARCWELVFDQYGSNLLKMAQETRGGNTVVRFSVSVPGDGEWELVCDGAAGKIVKSERIQGS